MFDWQKKHPTHSLGVCVCVCCWRCLYLTCNKYVLQWYRIIRILNNSICVPFRRKLRAFDLVYVCVIVLWLSFGIGEWKPKPKLFIASACNMHVHMHMHIHGRPIRNYFALFHAYKRNWNSERAISQRGRERGQRVYILRHSKCCSSMCACVCVRASKSVCLQHSKIMDYMWNITFDCMLDYMLLCVLPNGENIVVDVISIGICVLYKYYTRKNRLAAKGQLTKVREKKWEILIQASLVSSGRKPKI